MTRRTDERRGKTELRTRAEDRFAARSSGETGLEFSSFSNAVAIVHELQVHQIELEMQNEELARSRVEAEAARERYADLYDFAPIGYFTVSHESAICDVNLTGARLLGVERSRLVGRRLGSFIAEADRPAFNTALSTALKSHTQESCEVALASAADEASFPPYLQMTVLAAPGGEEVRVVAVDSTERKRTEEQIRTSQKLEAIGQLAGGVAHDFNNVLTVILNHADVALETVGTDVPLHQNLVELKAAAERAAALTRQLLAFSHKQAVRPQVVDLNRLLGKIADLLRRLLGEHIELVLSLDADLGPVKLDPTQFDQVVMNLAVNARDAMPDGGILTISTANLDLSVGSGQRGLTVSPGPFVRLTVSDTGTGMDATTMVHMFEPFFTTKPKGHGTGLGLSTVFGIVKQCGGQLTVHSELAKGSTFEIDFPRSAASFGLEADPAGRAKVADKLATETVLVVEDEGALLRIATRVLQAAGYIVLAAVSGADALREGERHVAPIHLVVSDIVMPGMSGVAFAERMKRLHPETKVLYMSGYTDDELSHQGVTDPQVQLLSKPFTPEQLRRKVREILDG